MTLQRPNHNKIQQANTARHEGRKIVERIDSEIARLEEASK